MNKLKHELSLRPQLHLQLGYVLFMTAFAAITQAIIPNEQFSIAAPAIIGITAVLITSFSETRDMRCFYKNLARVAVIATIMLAIVTFIDLAIGRDSTTAKHLGSAIGQFLVGLVFGRLEANKEKKAANGNAQ